MVQHWIISEQLSKNGWSNLKNCRYKSCISLSTLSIQTNCHFKMINKFQNLCYFIWYKCKNIFHLIVGRGLRMFSCHVQFWYNQTNTSYFIAFLTALSSSVEKEKLLKEVTTMSLLIHPNVMPLIGLCFDEEMPLLIMPFMSKGNVLEYVKQNEVDLHKDQEASEVEVLTLLVYIRYGTGFCCL